jgi:hypothetical protein
MGQAKSADKEVSIRGIAGPFSVLAQNFAPGTSAADVENAFTRVGGQILKCVVLKTEPFVLVEAVFARREGGELAINKFDGVMVCCRLSNPLFLLSFLSPLQSGHLVSNTNMTWHAGGWVHLTSLS